MDLPEDIEEVKRRLGIASGRVMGLPELRLAQIQLMEWLVDAAVERWPDAMALKWNDVRYAAVWANGQHRWPGIENIAAALSAAERHIIRGSEPLA